MSNETYDLNYFFHDYVTEDISAYGIGELHIYHYKETLFGVRSFREKVSYFVDIASIKPVSSHFAPTIDQLTEQHIKEAYEEVDHTGEETSRLPMPELVDVSLQMLARETAALLDSKILNMGKE